MSGLQVKCYLLANEGKINKRSVEKATEIRRFNIEFGVNGLYNTLLEKIMLYFKDMFASKDEIKTYYLDDEDEFIGFSSDSEFQYGVDVQLALKMSNVSFNVSQNVFKVYICKRKVESSSSSSDDEAQNEADNRIHYGVVCDGCNGSVIGIRHKCSVCPNYDLCETCEAKGIHKAENHKFIKIALPRFFKPRCGGGKFRHHRHHQRHHHHQQAPNMFGDMFTNLRSSMSTINDEQHLKKFGEYLKGVLSPLGVDVDYYVDTVLKKPEEAKKEETEKPKQETSTTNDAKMETTPANISVNLIDPITQSVQTVSFNDNNNGTTTTVTTTTSSPNGITSTSSSSSSSSSSNNSIPPRAQHEDVDGFNMVDMEKEVKIMKAVEQLKEMGFNDENNWLTALVTSKDGNINAVLDTLAPFGFRQ